MSTPTSTITAAITLSGPGMTSQSLNVSEQVQISIGNPAIESGAIAVPTSDRVVATGPTGGGYVYIKNTEPSAATEVTIKYTSYIVGVLRPGEWAFLPIRAGEQLVVVASVASTAEYAVWRKA